MNYIGRWMTRALRIPIRSLRQERFEETSWDQSGQRRQGQGGEPANEALFDIQTRYYLTDCIGRCSTSSQRQDSRRI